jgi:hypothetical protein
MGTFTAERFKEWVKGIDQNFRKVALKLTFRIQKRAVHFVIKEIRSRRTVFQFTASSHVRFDDDDVVMSVEEFTSR